MVGKSAQKSIGVMEVFTVEKFGMKQEGLLRKSGKRLSLDNTVNLLFHQFIKKWTEIAYSHY